MKLSFSGLIREPLMHFCLIGLLLFTGHELWQRHVVRADYMITVSPEEMQRQAVIFAGENRRQPTDEDIKALLFAHVEEEALMREAVRLGLGENDTIIRRRLAQKMRFIIEDVSPPALPSEPALHLWFQTHIDTFTRPETRSFSHIYLSPETGDNESLEARAARVLAKASDENWESLGDPFMLKRDFQELSAVDVNRLFGPDFAKGIFTAKGHSQNDNWQGPIASAFGLHLIRIRDITPAQTPKLSDIRPEVESAWSETAGRQANQDRLKAVIKKYKVNVKTPDVKPDRAIKPIPAP